MTIVKKSLEDLDGGVGDWRVFHVFLSVRAFRPLCRGSIVEYSDPVLPQWQSIVGHIGPQLSQ